MKPFEYVKPGTLAEAISALDAGGDDARALSGGTDLIVQMRAGRNVVGNVIDVKGVPETNIISHSKKDGLTIGSSVPCYRIYNDEGIQQTYAGLVDSVSIIGGTGIQGPESLSGRPASLSRRRRSTGGPAGAALCPSPGRRCTPETGAPSRERPGLA